MEICDICKDLKKKVRAFAQLVEVHDKESDVRRHSVLCLDCMNKVEVKLDEAGIKGYEL